ncbi:hypothetical protein [Propionivibrio sp.]|uniref:hypothetical protein n=1 Tax=Propionivibrio sp. TaxID=2212460 RepID=UPI00272ECF91|nr:hypothetical protein [Propionivibrio sp.]
MSLVDVFVTPGGALVGVDTHARTLDGELIEVAKIVCLPHISTVFAFRGLSDVFFLANYFFLSHRSGFDELAEGMGDIIRKTMESHKTNAGNHADENANFIVVGYSNKYGRMAGHAFEQAAGSSEIMEKRDFPQLLAPAWGNPDDFRRLNVRANRAGMIAVAKEQCRLVKERGPAEATAGGRLIIAEVKKGSILMEQACRL